MILWAFDAIAMLPDRASERIFPISFDDFPAIVDYCRIAMMTIENTVSQLDSCDIYPLGNMVT